MVNESKFGRQQGLTESSQACMTGKLEMEILARPEIGTSLEENFGTGIGI